MHRLVVWLVAAALVAPSFAARNLLGNGGGEDGQTLWGGDTEYVTEAGEAHSGKACFKGTVTEKNRHHRLTQTVPLEAEVPYRVSLWARSDNRNMVVIWIEKGDDRRQVGRWESTAKQWRRYETVFSVPSSGNWDFQFIVPSSHGNGRLGTAWVDDLTIEALAAGRPTRLSPEGTIADHLALTSGPGGSLWASWEAFGEDRDQLVVASLDPGPPVAVRQTWTVDFGRNAFTLWPRLVGGPSGVWLIAAVEVTGRWDIYAAPVGAEGPGQPVAVTRDAAADVQVAGALDGDTLQLAWVSNRDGPRRVYAASVKGGRSSEPVAVSEERCYNPSVAVGGGRVYVVYDRFLAGNRDVYLRVRENGRWSDSRRLTKSNKVDLNPVAVWWRDALWIAWETGWFNGYRIASLDRKTVMVARVTDDGLAATKGLPAGVPGRYIEQPGLVVDGADRLWLAMRQARGERGRGGWDTKLACYTGDAWTEWVQVSGVSGRAREPAVTAVGDLVVGGNQADNILGAWTTNEKAAGVWMRVEALAVSTAEVPPAKDLQTEPYADADVENFTAAADRERMGEERGRFTFDLGGRTLNGYFGDFHEHSDISICARGADQRPEEDYTSMREVARIDFGALTDHGYNVAAPIWRYSAKITRANDDPGTFVTFVGEEWTSNNERNTKPPGYYGHRNLIFADPYYPTWYNSRDKKYYTPQQMWDLLAGQNYIMIPHQLADSGTNVPTDWNYTNELYQPVAEIFQARESYEADDGPRRTKNGYPGYFLQDVWARGVKIGVIASPDHGGGKGKAGVLVEDLTRESVLDACRARHTWGTSAAKIAMAVTVDGHLMGDIVKQAEVTPVRVKVTVSAAGPVAAIRVIRNNQIIHSESDPGPDVTFEYLDNAPLDQNSYYYVRVEREDGELAWSSPVWLDRQA